MRHILFAAACWGAACLGARVGNAQSVPPRRPIPGRALLDFPLGTLGEAPALSTASGGGLFNPAAILGLAPARLRASFAELQRAGDASADGQVLTAVARVDRRTLAGLGVARMSVGGGERTGLGDPESQGTVPYSTYVVSGVLARRLGGALGEHVGVGVAGRYRSATSDTVQGAVGAADVGLYADHLLGRRDLRLALASYLWLPGREATERPALHAAADVRVAGPDDAREVRLGVAHGATRDGARETFVYAAGRWRYAEGRLGIARANEIRETQTHTRLGVAFHASRFSVGVGCETSESSLGALYQFTLSTLLK